jgi:tetratricopeptide (TPR) repeat protein
VKAKAAELLKRFGELYKEGRYKEAETYAAIARELDPDDGAAAAAIHMARAHARHHRGEASEIDSESESSEISEAAPQIKDRAVAELLRKYHEACAKARKLAERALSIDPTCFSKEKGAEEQAEKHGEE